MAFRHDTAQHSQGDAEGTTAAGITPQSNQVAGQMADKMTYTGRHNLHKRIWPSQAMLMGLVSLMSSRVFTQADALLYREQTSVGHSMCCRKGESSWVPVVGVLDTHS